MGNSTHFLASFIPSPHIAIFVVTGLGFFLYVHIMVLGMGGGGVCTCVCVCVSPIDHIQYADTLLD